MHSYTLGFSPYTHTQIQIQNLQNVQTNHLMRTDMNKSHFRKKQKDKSLTPKDASAKRG